MIMKQAVSRELELKRQRPRKPACHSSNKITDCETQCTSTTHVSESKEVLQSVHSAPVLVYSRDVDIALLAVVVVHHSSPRNPEPHESSKHLYHHTTLTALSDRVGVHLEPR
jgi:hypothetical protein